VCLTPPSQKQLAGTQYYSTLSSNNRRMLMRSREFSATLGRQGRPRTESRQTAIIPTIYFGEHGEAGKMKCLMLIQNKEKFVELKKDTTRGDKRGICHYPKGYNVKRIKMFEGLKRKSDRPHF
jgi:hypothetical protein